MKLALGSAQFGLDYGVTNRCGKVPLAEIEKILSVASDAGIDTIDTACAYGDAEQRLGTILGQSDSFKVLSKLPAGIKPDAIVSCVDESLKNLKIAALDGLLVHQAADLQGPQEQMIYSKMMLLQETGLCKRSGVSVYTVEEAEYIVESNPIALLQAPLNVLDQRFATPEVQSLLARKGVVLHVRSLLLQGVIVTPPSELPEYFQPYLHYLTRIHGLASRFGVAPITIALAIIYSLPTVEKAVIGCCSVEQLRQITTAYYEAKDLVDQISFEALVCPDENLYLPTNWPHES